MRTKKNDLANVLNSPENVEKISIVCRILSDMMSDCGFNYFQFTGKYVSEKNINVKIDIKNERT